MHYRNLGKTGLKVSEVGMGCNRLGESIHSDDHWDDLVRRAMDLGVNNFDTSEAYGKGRSEEVLGRAIGNRGDMYIASKASPKTIDDVRQITSGIIFEAVEKSLKRLKRECIDIYQLHSPNQEMLERDDWAEGLLRLKEQGKIKHCAIAVNSAKDGIWAIEHGVAEVLQITYSIFETTPEEGLFDLAKEQGVGLLVRRPMERGVLTGKFKPSQEVASDHRASMEKDRLPRMIEKAETLRSVGEAYPGGMTRMALQFGLGNDAVSCIIPGARSVEQLEENASASYGGNFSAGVRAQIDAVRDTWEA
ncbi:MAG: aryl-alcohol dehydrogenase-like predicted oxidoreductase [Candidatus Latescibacterota bacterium]|jgi:aryl-alcohol dehydrogenase-like predicted oxidoreductase